MTEANDTYRYDAFIIYSHHDKEWVQGWLLPQLEAAGLRICIDFRDFEPGLPSLVNIENAVEHSRKTLIVLTPDWVKSEWTTFEGLLIQTGDPAGRRARMIPLMLKPCKPPKRIAMLTYLDFTQPSGVEFQFGRLVLAVRGEPIPDSPRPVSESLGIPSPRERGEDTPGISRKTDLEQHVRESYGLIREYEAKIQVEYDPQAKLRWQRQAVEQRDNIHRWLSEYQSLCQRLERSVPDDIAQIAASPEFQHL
jgi:hypothetical protein